MSNESFEIDMDRLHLELVKQPRMYHDCAERLATANSEVDRLKGRLELAAAKVEMEVRDNPSSFGIRKVTESLVEKAVTLDARYQKALGEYNQGRAIARHLEAQARTLEQRKSALENLVKLRLADYFSEARIGSDAREDANERLRREAFEATRGRR